MTQLECFACGARFRSALAEAKHRHNFPTLCKRNRQFKRWQNGIAKETTNAKA